MLPLVQPGADCTEHKARPWCVKHLWASHQRVVKGGGESGGALQQCSFECVHTLPQCPRSSLSHCNAFVGVHEILERWHIHTDIYPAPADQPNY